MPPRQASRCYRVIQSQASSPLETLWITDNVLSRAFERYCSVSLVSRRQASAAPGPLENRRRLGKRRMTELNSAQLHPALPPWALPNVMDASQWHWEPPTSLSHRTRGDGEAVAGWPLPTLQAPQWLVDWVEEREKTTLKLDEEIEAPERAGHHDAEPLLGRFSELGAADSLSVGEFCLKYRGLCAELEQQLTLGTIMPEELDGLLKEAYTAAGSRLGMDTSKRPLPRLLFSSTIRGIASCKVLGSDAFAASFWRTVALRMLDLPANDDLGRILDAFVRSAPQQCFDAGHPDILSVLDKIFVAWGEPRALDLATMAQYMDRARDASRVASELLAAAQSHAEQDEFTAARAAIAGATATLTACRRYMNKAARAMLSGKSHTNPVADSVNGLASDDGTPLLRAATNLILDKPFHAREMQHQMRYTWLSVLARAPTVGEGLLLESCLTLFGPATSSLSLSGTEICRLLLIHWKSTGCLESFKDRRDYVDRVCSDRDPVAMASLAQAVYRSASPEDCAALFGTLWKFLGAFDRSGELVASMEALGASYRLAPRFLKAVALASDDHHVAMKLHSLCISQSHKPGPQWEPAFWDRFVDRMAADPAVSSFFLLQVLGAGSHLATRGEGGVKGDAGRQGPRRRKRVCGTPQSVAHVERLATQLAHSRDLHNRVALRWVSLCVRYLARHRRRLSVSSLQALGRVLTRDLAEGRPGRTARLRWYVHLVARHLGERAGLAVAVQLRRWREGSHRLWLVEERRANHRPRL